uniref:Uncharacterized protein n=1 Tax=Anguilla anguilla TaxID=7936 RepID=A0A0E9QFU7_ANGAN
MLIELQSAGNIECKLGTKSVFYS